MSDGPSDARRKMESGGFRFATLGRNFRLVMLTGKHAGLEVELCEAVIRPTESADIYEVILPGLEGRGRIVPENKNQN